MLLPFGALSDPSCDRFNFFGREFDAGVGGRHALGRLFGGDAANHLALFGMALDNGVLAVGQFGFGVFFVIETERDVLVLGVRAVADVALVGEDGTNVLIEFDRWFGGAAEQVVPNPIPNPTRKQKRVNRFMRRNTLTVFLFG